MKILGIFFDHCLVVNDPEDVGTCSREFNIVRAEQNGLPMMVGKILEQAHQFATARIVEEG